MHLWRPPYMINITSHLHLHCGLLLCFGLGESSSQHSLHYQSPRSVL
ncbi:hypothetical protein M758_1G066400 [Ceratodon purpureus]|nr:hypothetical protein M758_1G066400 [Ceratodon purpureus]